MLPFLGFTQRNAVDTEVARSSDLATSADSKHLSHTHECKDILSLDDIAVELCELKEILKKQHGSDAAKYDELNQLLNKLVEFELGRFLVKSKGALSGGLKRYAKQT